MKITQATCSLLATMLPFALGSIAGAATLTYDADLGTTGAQDGSGSGWNADLANTSFWDGAANVLWPNTTADEAVFGTASGAAGTVTTGTVNANKITFNAPGSGNYNLSGGTITLGGTSPTIAANVDASITSGLVGTAGLTKSGTGTLTLSGTNTYTGATTISAGAVTYSGSSASTGGGALSLGTASGNRAVLNLSSTEAVTHGNGTAAATLNVGGTGASSNGAGAINLASGTVNFRPSGNYMPVGNGGYGSLVVSGGIMNFTNTTGIRIADNTGGLGSYVQTSGTANIARVFVVGGNSGTAPSGVATLTGGTLNNPGYEYLLGNAGTATGTLNVGTQAGGSGTLITGNSNGIVVGGGSSATSALNLNAGTVQLNAGVIKRNTGTGLVNLNGGTIKANANGLTLINNTVSSANVFNGGLKVDTQNFNATIAANLLTTTGNGIYPSGGVIAMPAPAGAGYIGAPLITVTTSGSGTGASAIANVVNGQVTGVTLTCPGQGYAAGDTVTFTFAGGGATTAAAPFAHVLTAGDLAANGAGGLTKLGAGMLTLTGANTFNGPWSVSGTVVTNDLSLNNTTLTFQGFNPASPTPPLQASTSFTTGGIVQVHVSGTFIQGSWPLIFYPAGGSIGGDGISALQLQTSTLPRGVVAELEDNPSNSSVDLKVTGFNPLTWKGNAGSVWDLNTTTNWLIGAVAEKYLDGDLVRFNDNATGTTSVTLNTTVTPQSVAFDNDTKAYTLGGTGSIAGTCGLTKTNNGTVTILNANTFTGATKVDGGTLQLGNGTVNGSIAGPLVNNANVVFHPSGTATFAGSISGGAATFVKSGSGTLIVTSPTNSSTGTFQVNEGTLQFGDASVNGALGSASYELAAGTSLRLEQATAATPPWAMISGAGDIFLNSAQAINGSANWGTLALPETYTGVLRVEKGRVDAIGGESRLGGTSMIEIMSGAQFLAFESVDPYTTPIEIAGNGWGETGFPGGLRLAADRTATWAGSVTLTADSGIMAQRGTNFTVTGSITGDYQCEFYAGDPSGDSGVLTIAPAAEAQNSYTSTRINGRPNGSIVAGNANAFSTGPLEVVSAILKLNGHDLSFANLGGAGGAIGNYSATTPATLTVGADNTSTSYAGVLRNGDVAPLALVKTGTGTITLNGANSYTGNTTVSNGKLALTSPTLANSSTVTLAPGAVIELNTGAADLVGALVLGDYQASPGTYDSNHPTYGNYFSGNGSLVVGGAFESWAASKGLDGSPGKENGPTDDPEKDGIDNQTEFYLDGNPLASDPAILPDQGMDDIYLTLTFERRDDAEAAVTTQAIQHGINLGTWVTTALGAETSTAPNGVIVTVEENDAAADEITVQIPRTLAIGGKLFGRLQVIK